MANRSPRYPTLSLNDAIEGARKIHNQDRRYAIDREVAMKHMGYSPMSGTANKAMASLTQYGLLEKAAKGQVQLTTEAEDIILGDDPNAKSSALTKCAYAPALFSGLKDRFKEGTPSSEALRSHLIREGFTDTALAPAIKAYLETVAYLEQEIDIESHENERQNDANLPARDDEQSRFGGASVGDLVQWDVNGVLQFQQPTQVLSIHESGDWVFVEGSTTGIPMNEVIVEKAIPTAPNPPVAPVAPPVPKPAPVATTDNGEREWVRTPLGKGVFARILVTEQLSDQQIEKLRIVLDAMKEGE